RLAQRPYERGRLARRHRAVELLTVVRGRPVSSGLGEERLEVAPSLVVLRARRYLSVQVVGSQLVGRARARVAVLEGGEDLRVAEDLAPNRRVAVRPPAHRLVVPIHE